MKPSRLTEVLSSLMRQRWPAFIWGPPGIGKSSIVRKIADSAKLPVIDLRASLLDPTDLRGIPSIQNGMATWCPPSFLPKQNDKPGILFLDEINAAPPLVQASLYQLVLDKRIGEYELPPNWWIVAAGNRQQDKAVTFRMSSALVNRFVHLSLEPDVSDWRDWAIDNRLDPIVVSFIGVRPSLLSQPPGESAAYPTPRSWEMLSNVINTFGGYKKCTDIIPGIIGDAAAIEFSAFLKQSINEKDMLKILEDPLKATLPKNLDGIYMLTSWLAFNAEKLGVLQASATLLNRIPPEFAVVLARDMLKAKAAFSKEPGYKTFIKEHGNLLVR